MDRFSVDAEFEGACGAVEVLIDTLEDVNLERPVDHVSGKIRKGSADADRVTTLLPCDVWREDPATLAGADLDSARDHCSA